MAVTCLSSSVDSKDLCRAEGNVRNVHGKNVGVGSNKWDCVCVCLSVCLKKGRFSEGESVGLNT